MESDIVRRVLDLEEIKSYHCQGMLHFFFPLDLGGDVAIAYLNPLPVRDACGKFLGFGTLTRISPDSLGVDAGLIEGELFLTRESPERLDLEQDTRDYFLVADDCARFYTGEVGERDTKHLTNVEIKSLRLVGDFTGGVQAVW